MDTNTGEISGVLNEAGIFKFTVLATDGFVNASKEFSISVTGADCQMAVEAIISEDAEKEINKQMETNVELKRNLSIYLTGLFGK